MKEILRIYREIIAIEDTFKNLSDDEKGKLLQRIPQELQEKLKDNLKAFQEVIEQLLL